MPTPIATIHHLGGGWTNFEVLQHDQGLHGLGAADGLLTKDELFSRIGDLKSQKSQLESQGKSTLLLTFELASATDLYNEMSVVGAAAVQYLPEPIMNLPEGVRRRATDLLRVNGASELTPLMVDEAIAQTNLMHAATGALLSSKQKALAELTSLKEALLALDSSHPWYDL